MAFVKAFLPYGADTFAVAALDGGLFYSAEKSSENNGDVAHIALPTQDDFISPVVSFFGDFTFNGETPTEGSAIGMDIGAYVGGKYVRAVLIEDIKLDIEDLLDAAATATLKDDLKVLGKIYKGADEFEGSSKSDFMSAYAGDDTLSGGGGDDTLEGGKGSDEIDLGKGGKDVVRVTFSNGDHDTILRFDGKDRLALDTKAFDVLEEVKGRLDPDMLRFGTEAEDGDDFLVYDKASGQLLFDADGKGGKGPVLIAEFTDGTDLQASDIILF